MGACRSVSWRSVNSAEPAVERVSISRNSSAKTLPAVFACLLAGCDSGSASAFSEPMTLGGREVSAQTLNDGRSLSLPKVLVSNNQTATLDSVAGR